MSQRCLLQFMTPFIKLRMGKLRRIVKIEAKFFEQKASASIDDL